MATYRLLDANGNVQKIKAASMAQARFALAQIDDLNARLPDGGRGLAKDWNEGDDAPCVEGVAA